MKIHETFISASVNPRSHCLTSCKTKPFIVYASSLQLVVQEYPGRHFQVGTIKSLSEKRHNKPISVLKRIKSPHTKEESDEFVSGGTDSRVVLWKMNEETEKIEYVSVLDGCSGSIGAVCGVSSDDNKVIAATWVSESGNGFRAWWTDKSGEAVKSYDIQLEQSAFALCLDGFKYNGTVLLAVGTSKRFIELYGEGEDRSSFTRLISVAGHTDWIHSVAFNDNASHLLLASAGQDTYVRLWSIEKDIAEVIEKTHENQEDELTSSRNKFEMVENGEKVDMRISSYAVMQGHDDWVHSTEWNNDGTALLTASSDKSCIVWREVNDIWRDDVRLGIIGGQAAGFFSAVFSHCGGFIMANSYFGGVYSWTAEDESKTYWKPMPMSGGHVGEVRDVDWQTGADGTSKFLVSVGQDQTTRVFAKIKYEGFFEIARPQVHGHDMQCISMVTPSLFVSGAEEKVFRAFRAPRAFMSSLQALSGIEPENAFGASKLAEFGASVPALGLSNKPMEEGQTADAEHWEDEAFRAAPTVLKTEPTEDILQQHTLWPEEHKLYGHGYEVYAIATNPTSTVLATACKSSHAEHSVVILWSTADWSKKAEIPGHQLTVTQIAWNPSGTTLMTVSRDRTVKLYKEKNNDVNGFDYQCTWTSAKQHTRIIWACDWFDDSCHFVTVARDQKVIVWKTNEEFCAEPIAVTKLAEPVTAVAVSSGSVNDAIISCGLQTGEIIFLQMKGADLNIIHSIDKSPIQIDSAILRLRFSRPYGDEQQLAVASTDAKLRVFTVVK